MKTEDNRKLPSGDENAFRIKKADEKMKLIEEMLISLKNKAIAINAKVQSEKVTETEFPVKRKSKYSLKFHENIVNMKSKNPAPAKVLVAGLQERLKTLLEELRGVSKSKKYYKRQHTKSRTPDSQRFADSRRI